MPRTVVSTIRVSSISSRVPCSAASCSGEPTAEPSRTQATLTWSNDRARVAITSGSPIDRLRPSRLDLRKRGRRSRRSPHGVPARDQLPREQARPRQPQPMIRQRANARPTAAGAQLVAPCSRSALSAPGLDLLGRELRLASGALALVVRAQHLVEVLRLERLATLGQLARRLQARAAPDRTRGSSARAARTRAPERPGHRPPRG